MPHQCTTCGHVFADGSTEMLGGCPECGNNKFQFHAGEVPEEPPDENPPDADSGGGVASRVGRAADTVRDLVSDDAPQDTGADATGEDWPEWPDEESPTDGDDIIEAPSEPTAPAEDRVQADARTDVVADADLLDGSGGAGADAAGDDSGAHAGSSGGEAAPSTDDATTLGSGADGPGNDTPPSPDDGTVVSEPSEEEADLAALREELNDQFESIRIVEPGQYELNLMELFNRDEYIIALQEDGRYVIEVPDTWRDDETSPGGE
jgi:predicted  nucleic acid-binding Zn-ribbon protein